MVEPASAQASAFSHCSSRHTETIAILECVSDTIQQQLEQGGGDDANHSTSNEEKMTDWLLVLTGAMVFFMQTGFAMLCAGSVRKKNVQNTMLKNLLDVCGAAVAFYSVGYAFAFGGQDDSSENVTFVGTSNFFNMGNVNLAFWFNQFAFSAASVTIVAGTLAERCQMTAYLCYSVILTGWVYPVIVHSLWSNHGFLSPFLAQPLAGIGAIDFAGSGVVHLTGGTTALIATHVLGARKGRFFDAHTGRQLDKPRPFPGHSKALQLMGTLVLWFGWYGFNTGSALHLQESQNRSEVAAVAAVNTSLSGACGGITALFANLVLVERLTGELFFDLTSAMNGALGGLVAITAGCGVVENWAACVIGCISGFAYLGGTRLMLRLKLDDAVDAIAVHGICGFWGLLSVGLLASPQRMLTAFGSDAHAGLFYSWANGSSDAALLGTNLLAVAFILGWSTTIMLPFFLWLNYKGWFRSDSIEEMVGLDLSYHGGTQVLEQYSEDFKQERAQVAAYQRKRQQKQNIAKSKKKNRGSPSTIVKSSSEDNSSVDDESSVEEGSTSQSQSQSQGSWSHLTGSAPPSQDHFSTHHMVPSLEPLPTGNSSEPLEAPLASAEQEQQEVHDDQKTAGVSKATETPV